MTLSDIYNHLLQRYDINTAGEMVEQFSDKGTRHSYIDQYQDLLAPYHPEARILEIGVMSGASILLWDTWFDSAEITGIDLRPDFNEPRPWHNLLQEPHIDIHWTVDSTEPSQFPEQRRFDIIIDDGSHRVEDQMKTFLNYFDHLAPGGIYIIEDIEDDASFDRLEYYVHRRIQKYGTPSGYRVGSHRGRKHGRADDQMLWVQLKP
jgi:SAM-dependent methyltransferase